MAELKQSTAIVPTGNAYDFRIQEYDAAGKVSQLVVPVPQDATVQTIRDSLMLRTAVLKTTTWAQRTIPQIIAAIMFADRLGLDIELGDVYTTDGRPAISAEGRIKLAQKDSRYQGHTTTFRELDTPLNKPKCSFKNDLECTVTVHVHGWPNPIRRTARLSSWYKDTPAWNDRPEHQLELNTLGHACRFLRPVGDAEDIPVLEAVVVK